MTDAGNVSSDTADAALTALAADLVEELAAGRAIELAAGLADPPRSRGWRTLSPRQLGLAEAANPDYRHGVTPDRSGHEDRRRHCEICGGTRGELVPGADGEDGAWTCADERECEARKLRRYPPRPDLVPDAVLSAVGAADRQLLPREPAAARQEPPESQQEQYTPPGWSAAITNGVYDVHGQWHPPVQLPAAWHPTAHLISGGASMSHAISGGAYMGHAMSGMARGQRLPVPPSGPQQPAPGSQSAGNEIPPEGLPEGVDEALYAGHGVDVQLQRPELPEAALQRPARSRSRRTRWR